MDDTINTVKLKEAKEGEVFVIMCSVCRQVPAVDYA